MKLKASLITALICLLATVNPVFVLADENETIFSNQISQNENPEVSGEEQIITEEGFVEHEEKSPAAWAVFPFVLLLLLIAVGPLTFKHFWHKFYPHISISMAVLVVGYYMFYLNNFHQPLHAGAEYFSFICLLASLYVASGGILIKVDREGTPMTNVGLLIFGALIANLIGTTGASMLLIRPFIRLNKDRVRPYHIVFFIFMVSNVGGCLTPIGDPPLFLGFLKGIPFFWTLEHLWMKWFVGIGFLSLMFYIIDRRNIRKSTKVVTIQDFSNEISVKGKKNFVWLAVIIAAVFIDPNVLDWVPALVIHGEKFSYIREFIMLSVVFFSFRFANKECLKGNEFDFLPIKEVGFLFIGIFGTMMPALQLIGEFAKSPDGSQLITIGSLYWMTGILSGFLDNAPTYLNFLAAGMAKEGLNINYNDQVLLFSQANIMELMAISVSAVFFGAMTYIGNGPNFMVKAIAEQVGIIMPSFFSYIVRYSFPILLPLVFIIWLFFIYFA